MSDLTCEECGEEMIDAGIVGVNCVNRECPSNVRIREALRNMNMNMSKLKGQIAELPPLDIDAQIRMVESSIDNIPTQLRTALLGSLRKVKTAKDTIEWVKKDMQYKAPEQIPGLMPRWIGMVFSVFE